MVWLGQCLSLLPVCRLSLPLFVLPVSLRSLPLSLVLSLFVSLQIGGEPFEAVCESFGSTWSVSLSLFHAERQERHRETLVAWEKGTDMLAVSVHVSIAVDTYVGESAVWGLCFVAAEVQEVEIFWSVAE